MQSVYETYRALPICKELLCLADGRITESDFCYPAGAQPIGFEGSILYCFLPEYGDMVFACNPESCTDRLVYPLAQNFTDFLRLILACGTANPVEQIVWMDREQFETHMASEKERLTPEHRRVLEQITHIFDLHPMEDPFGYVKAMQADFDDRKIRYRAAYYEVMGLEAPYTGAAGEADA